MFSECLHSLADTANQLILAYGIHKSSQVKTSMYPKLHENLSLVLLILSN
jgi:zinc transporter 9